MEVDNIPWYYRCSKTFQTELLGDLLNVGEIVGCIAMDLTQCGFALMFGTRMVILKEITSGIPNKHRDGGQSAKRFQHIREEAKHDWFKRIADYARIYFLDNQRVKKLIIHGESFTKREFLKQDLLEYRLQQIAELSDGCYAGEDGLYECKNMISNL